MPKLRPFSAERDGMVVDLVVDQSLPTATVTSRTPFEAVVDGAGYGGGLILFVDEGRLSALEYWWVTVDKPDEFPPTSAIGSPASPRRGHSARHAHRHERARCAARADVRVQRLAVVARVRPRD